MRRKTNRELSLRLAILRRGWARRCYFAIHCAGQFRAQMRRVAVERRNAT